MKPKTLQLLVATALVLTVGSVASAATPTGGAIKSTSAGFKTNIDQRRSAFWANHFLSTFAGYQNYNTYSTSSASLWRWARDADSVQHIAAHANNGFITVESPTTYLVAGRGGESNGGSSYYLSTYGANDLNANRLWVFAGCNTALTSGTYGNLLDMATTKKVDAAIGWASLTYWPTGDRDNAGNMYFHEFYFYAGYMGTTLATAHANAIYNMQAWEGATSGFENVVMRGTVGGSATIKPAQWGRWD